MCEMSVASQKALKAADIAARLVQSTILPENNNIDDVLRTFDTAYRHVKDKMDNEVR